MAAHGNIAEFDRRAEDWAAYCERLEQYFLANDVGDADKQRAILLSVCGAGTYQLIRNLAAPARPSEKSFEDIVKLVQEHHNPPPSAIIQRYRFHSRSQKEGESIAEFVAELRKLSEHCQFKDALDAMLRDRVVCGVRDARVQRTLLAKPDLTFKMAFTLAQAAEVAEQNAKDLQKSHATIAPVHAVQKQQSKPVGRNCYRCGGKHAADTCRFKDTECHFCHKRDTSPRSAVPSCKETRTPAQPEHVIIDRTPRAAARIGSLVLNTICKRKNSRKEWLIPLTTCSQ